MTAFGEKISVLVVAAVLLALTLAVRADGLCV